MRPFFTSTESQESKSDIARQCSISDYCYALSVPELVIADAKLVLSKVVTRIVNSVGLQVVLCVCVFVCIRLVFLLLHYLSITLL